MLDNKEIYAMNATINKQTSTYKQDMKSSEKLALLNAIINEIEAMYANQVWTLVDRPYKAIICFIILSLKGTGEYFTSTILP